MITPKENKPKQSPIMTEQQQAQQKLYELGLATKPEVRAPVQMNSWGTPVASRQ